MTHKNDENKTLLQLANAHFIRVFFTQRTNQVNISKKNLIDSLKYFIILRKITSFNPSILPHRCEHMMLIDCNISDCSFIIALRDLKF